MVEECDNAATGEGEMLDADRHADSPEADPSESAPPQAASAPQILLARTRALVAQLRPWRYRGPALLGALAAAWIFGVPLVLGPVVDVVPVVRANFVQSVVASGHVEAPFRVTIGSQITGVVVDVPVSEGQTVSAGDTLIALDDREARSSVVQTEGVVAQAEARVRQMRELTLPSAEQSLFQAKATLTNAQLAFDRISQLARTGVSTRVALDEATKSLDIARSQVRSAEFLVYTNRPGGSDYVMVETQLEQARANLRTAQARLSYTKIAAPRDGVLISRNVERGNVVQPANVLMALSPAGETQLVVQIDEKNLALVALGQKALVSADAYPKEIFAAEVVYINPGIDLQRASVEVKLRVPNPPADLRQDMTVSIDIETATRAGALVAPSTVLRGLSTDKPWVLKVSGVRARRQAVTVGLVSGGRAEILDGLSENDLLVPSTSVIKDGARVRSRLALGRAS
jgi:HlyD family secretion protein